MGLFDTNAEKVASGFLREAKTKITNLQNWLKMMEEEIDRHQEGAFPIDWCSHMMDEALGIYNSVARCNGAVLVRGTDSEKEV